MVKIGPTVLEKMLTDDARQTIHNDGHQPIATGHLSDSGDLIIEESLRVECLQMQIWVI